MQETRINKNSKNAYSSSPNNPSIATSSTGLALDDWSVEDVESVLMDLVVAGIVIEEMI
jgi:hypothetical protein